ncbi:MAG: Hpt domain-containing protein [Chloroflexota bacterium]|nr:Hpt domain-containing protein [Chloroflexota bacterium]
MSQEILDMRIIEQLKMVMGDDAADVIADLVDTLLKSGSEQLSVMEQALADEDLEIVKFKAHTLKGSSGNMGAKAVSAVCFEMEKMAADDNLQGARNLFDGLFKNFEQAMVALKQLEF